MRVGNSPPPLFLPAMVQACGILVLLRGLNLRKPTPPALESLILNHWTTWQVPRKHFKSIYPLLCCLNPHFSIQDKYLFNSSLNTFCGEKNH